MGFEDGMGQEGKVRHSQGVEEYRICCERWSLFSDRLLDSRFGKTTVWFNIKCSIKQFREVVVKKWWSMIPLERVR